jgi:hypothetical protein
MAWCSVKAQGQLNLYLYFFIVMPIKSILVLSSHLRLCLPNGLFPSGFSIEMLYISRLPRMCYIFLGLDTLKCLRKSLTFDAPLIMHFLRPHVTSVLLCRFLAGGRGQGRDSSSLSRRPDWLWGTHNLLSNGYLGDRGCDKETGASPVPRLMRGAILLFPHTSLWPGTGLSTGQLYLHKCHSASTHLSNTGMHGSVYVRKFYYQSVQWLGYRRDDRGSIPGRGWEGIFLLATMFRPALGPNQPPIQWVPEAVSAGVKWPGREADHSPLPSAKVENAWSYLNVHCPLHLHGMVLG